MNFIYDFAKQDAEDQLPLDASGVIADTTQRRSLWHSILLVGLALVMLQTVMRSIVGNLLLPLTAVIAYPFFYPNDYRSKKPSRNRAWDYLRLLGIAADQFAWQRFVSFCCVFCAIPLVLLGPKDRYLPLRIPLSVFATTFLALLYLDMLPSQALHGLAFVGPRLAQASSDFSIVHFLSDSLSHVHPLGCRVVLGVAAIIGLVLIHGLFLTAPSLVLATVSIWMAWPFARRMKLDLDVAPNCTHLSDLHFTKVGENPIEESDVTGDQLAQAVRDAVSDGAEALVISGDITDSGGREEWLAFLQAVASAREKPRVPIILAPGNHDLFPYMRSFRPPCSSIPMSSRLVRLRKIRYLAAVQRLCPEMQVQVDGRERSLDEHLASQAPLLEACARNDAADLNEIDALWDSCFPMYCVIGLHAYVCMDTNRPASNVATSAFGRLPRSQARRVRELLDRLYDRPYLKVVLVGHHHMFTPFASRRNWRTKYLEIVSGRSVFSQATYCADYYLHGHRHVPFGFRMDRLKVVSAPSPRFPKHAST